MELIRDRTTDENEIEDIHDPVIKMTDPLLEVIIPAEEETIFAALRYNDKDMVERLVRQGFDVNYRQKGTYAWACDNIWAATRENLSLGFLTKSYPNQPA